MRLKLIVHLVRRETLEREYERLPYEPLTRTCWECRCARW
jgi:HPr kinase/phosphorylase